jgi:predicted transcriptional regulator
MIPALEASMAAENRVKLTVRLPPALVKKAHHFAIDHDTTVQALVEQALETLLKARGR